MSQHHLCEMVIIFLFLDKYLSSLLSEVFERAIQLFITIFKNNDSSSISVSQAAPGMVYMSCMYFLIISQG